MYRYHLICPSDFAVTERMHAFFQSPFLPELVGLGKLFKFSRHYLMQHLNNNMPVLLKFMILIEMSNTKGGTNV